ncbi:unnamed protein product [Urochloa humidicola]
MVRPLDRRRPSLGRIQPEELLPPPAPGSGAYRGSPRGSEPAAVRVRPATPDPELAACQWLPRCERARSPPWAATDRDAAASVLLSPTRFDSAPATNRAGAVAGGLIRCRWCRPRDRALTQPRHDSSV